MAGPGQKLQRGYVLPLATTLSRTVTCSHCPLQRRGTRKRRGGSIVIPSMWLLIIGTAAVAVLMVRDIARDLADR